MTAGDWNWKGKDGSRGGLRYESGNWGDILKMLWLAAVLGWKRRFCANIEYFDPFAGDVRYPLAHRTRSRFERARLPQLDFIREGFTDAGLWPSSASAAELIVGKGRVRVFDADAERLRHWRDAGGAVLEGDSGWDILAGAAPSDGAVWLVDPYDVVAEWRERLPIVVGKAREVSLLLYIYNRAAAKPEAFREYRAFRNRLEDLRGSLPLRLGRAGADAFLPRAHHEMLFLPGRADRENPELETLFDELETRTVSLLEAQGRAGVFDA